MILGLARQPRQDPHRQALRAVEVITSNEVGAGLRKTGDYHLFAICPSWDARLGTIGTLTKSSRTPSGCLAAPRARRQGNLTPRILRCLNELNVAMGATGPQRLAPPRALQRRVPPQPRLRRADSGRHDHSQARRRLWRQLPADGVPVPLVEGTKRHVMLIHA